MKHIITAIAIIAALTQSQCSLTPTQQDAAVKVTQVAITKLDKQKKLTAKERDIIKRGVLAATSPENRDTASLIAAATDVLNAAVKRGALDQATADDIDLALSLASLVL